MASRNPEVGSRWRERSRPGRIVEVLEQGLIEQMYYNPDTVLVKSVTIANMRKQAFPSRISIDAFHRRFRFFQGPRFHGEYIPDNLVPVTLVPVEVFSDDYGLMDAVSPWSDCNRAGGRIYRVDDMKHRNDGETITAYVPADQVEWFKKKWDQS